MEHINWSRCSLHCYWVISHFSHISFFLLFLFFLSGNAVLQLHTDVFTFLQHCCYVVVCRFVRSLMAFVCQEIKGLLTYLLTWRIFVASFMEIPPLSTEILGHPKKVLTGGRRTYGQPDGKPENITPPPRIVDGDIKMLPASWYKWNAALTVDVFGLHMVYFPFLPGSVWIRLRWGITFYRKYSKNSVLVKSVHSTKLR